MLKAVPPHRLRLVKTPYLAPRTHQRAWKPKPTGANGSRGGPTATHAVSYTSTKASSASKQQRGKVSSAGTRTRTRQSSGRIREGRAASSESRDHSSPRASDGGLVGDERGDVGVHENLVDLTAHLGEVVLLQRLEKLRPLKEALRHVKWP